MKNKVFYNIGIMLWPVILLISACGSSCEGKQEEEVFREAPTETYQHSRRHVANTEPVVIQLDSLSFGEAFNWQWRAKDIGDTFWWRGEQYVIRLKDDEE